MTNTELNLDEINFIIDHALNEDVKNGDITTNTLIPGDKEVKAYMMAKADGVVAGLAVAERIFKKLNSEINFKALVNEGDRVTSQTRIVEIEGSYRAILTGERLALNFLQRMSGIATKTSEFVDAVKEYKTEILDTRKTVPGLRTLDKYSVKMGGGTNHRIGLYDMVMIKDNHIEVAGSITEAVKQIRANVASEIKIEVETKNLDEVKEALEAGADIIMLDNMNNEQMTEAVKLIDGKAMVEASGSINMERVKEVAATGVDYISVGGLTHSVTALDIGMYIEV
ncbi:MAG: carboxylating nicotinate-nucleotide diphosphorylase [Melioribacteraceae bacterium]|nr:carboxylating nicotinate-nucleotide diphosphorylase [Melioribacteraceae bacterium]